jgi:hypothetical protein
LVPAVPFLKVRSGQDGVRGADITMLLTKSVDCPKVSVALMVKVAVPLLVGVPERKYVLPDIETESPYVLRVFVGVLRVNVEVDEAVAEPPMPTPTRPVFGMESDHAGGAAAGFRTTDCVADALDLGAPLNVEISFCAYSCA